MACRGADEAQGHTVARTQPSGRARGRQQLGPRNIESCALSVHSPACRTLLSPITLSPRLLPGRPSAPSARPTSYSEAMDRRTWAELVREARVGLGRISSFTARGPAQGHLQAPPTHTTQVTLSQHRPSPWQEQSQACSRSPSRAASPHPSSRLRASCRYPWQC